MRHMVRLHLQNLPAFHSAPVLEKPSQYVLLGMYRRSRRSFEWISYAWQFLRGDLRKRRYQRPPRILYSGSVKLETKSIRTGTWWRMWSGSSPVFLYQVVSKGRAVYWEWLVLVASLVRVEINIIQSTNPKGRPSFLVSETKWRCSQSYPYLCGPRRLFHPGGNLYSVEVKGRYRCNIRRHTMKDAIMRAVYAPCQ